ncbi:MAG TPA: TlpA disulfide reductase family protein [Anaerolineae bacterium]|nr:TlpA disulfide reductase family protein [Anaerolineae bacterium]
METWHTTDSTPSERKRSPVVAAAAAVALVVIALLAYAILTGPNRPPQIGEAVPPFTLDTFDGQSMDLTAHQGDVVIVNFFASWCVPCRQEAADLEETWQSYRDEDVQFFGIAYKDARSKAQAFLDEFGVTYPSAFDAGNRVARTYGVTGVPETFVVDQQGRLVRHILGAVTADELGNEIDALLAP